MEIIWDDLLNADEILIILERAIMQTTMLEILAPLGRDILRKFYGRKPQNDEKRRDVEQALLIARFSKMIEIFDWTPENRK